MDHPKGTIGRLLKPIEGDYLYGDNVELWKDKETYNTMVELTPEEVELFILFKEHQDVFHRLIKGKVLELRASKAILNFDGGGKLTEIRTEIKTYRSMRDE